MSLKSKIAKYGFGMAPLKNNIEIKNRFCIKQVQNLLNNCSTLSFAEIAESISTVKGLFNRIIKQNQWDWFTINMYFDYPTNKDIHIIISALTLLRQSIITDNFDTRQKSIIQLQNTNFMLYCENYLNYDESKDTSEEYIYILSRREEPDILKIGMTTRNIKKRVNEINSATGILYPYSARKVYKVKNCHQVEKDIHDILQNYRIRADREFFKISFQEACHVIETYLSSSEREFYN